MAYITQAEFMFAISPAMVLAIFDDNSDGVIDAATVDSYIGRGSSMADAWIAPVYTGPFPITQTPVPAMIRELTLLYTLAYTYERHPEYSRIADRGVADMLKRADEMGERLQSAVLRISDYAAQPKPANVGGIVRDDAQRVIVTSANGTSNRGDF
jgi:hypothetical protein